MSKIKGTMKVQFLDNGHWCNCETELTLRQAREALRVNFCHGWNDPKMDELDDIAHDKATEANVGDVIIGATGVKWRIAE